MKAELQFREDLLLSEGISEKEVKKIKKTLQKRPYLTKLYLLYVANTPNLHLEICDSGQLFLPFHPQKTYDIIGLARSWDEAVLLVQQIVNDCYAKRGDCNLKEYLAC